MSLHIYRVNHSIFAPTPGGSLRAGKTIPGEGGRDRNASGQTILGNGRKRVCRRMSGRRNLRIIRPSSAPGCGSNRLPGATSSPHILLRERPGKPGGWNFRATDGSPSPWERRIAKRLGLMQPSLAQPAELFPGPFRAASLSRIHSIDSKRRLISQDNFARQF